MPEPAATAPAADVRAVLRQVADAAGDWFDALPERPVRPDVTPADMRVPDVLPDGPSAVEDVVADLVRDAAPGLIAMGSPRFFGFVIGGAHPAGLAGDWLTSTWDQNAPLAGPSPAVAAIESVAGAWVLDLLGLPADASFAFVTGCQMAHVTALAAARHRLLADAGHDVERDGLAGAPPIASSRARSGTSRSTGRCASSASAPRRSCPSRSTRPARCAPARSGTRCARATGARPSSPRRRAT